MIANGTFDKLRIRDETSERTWTLDDVGFTQDGFAFRCYIDRDAHPLVDNGYVVQGVIDDEIVASGFISRIMPTEQNDEECLRLSVSPPTHKSVDESDLELDQ